MIDYNLSDLPPFEELIKTYDKAMLSSIVEAIEIDLNNLANCSERMLALKAKMHGVTVEEFVTSERTALQNRLQMVKEML
jgi:hypothetical protein